MSEPHPSVKLVSTFSDGILCTSFNVRYILTNFSDWSQAIKKRRQSVNKVSTCFLLHSEWCAWYHTIVGDLDRVQWFGDGRWICFSPGLICLVLSLNWKLLLHFLLLLFQQLLYSRPLRLFYQWDQLLQVCFQFAYLFRKQVRTTVLTVYHNILRNA